ncbi:MAG: hypothetical protein K6F67_04745 [Oscillospiraceae bacterium]|nr:hypothetical protein [Oscillospiraceae bacterium]
MKEKRILNALERVDEKYIEEAAPAKQKSKKPVWVIWVAAAACLCLAVGIAVPRLTDVFQKRGGTPSQTPEDSDSLVQEISALEFNGAFYEATDIPEALERYGLPSVITENMAGEHLSYLEPNGDAGYTESATETDIELLEYTPSSCRGVYVIRDRNKYLAALFCNILLLDDNSSTGMETLYGFYGIESPDDIVSITEVDWNRDKAVGNAVTEKSEIAAFYALSISLTSYGNNDFQKIVFDGIPEDQQVKAHTEFANDLRVIRIETKDGLRFYIKVHPSFGWIYGDGTLSYYQIDAQMTDWLSNNLNK